MLKSWYACRLAATAGLPFSIHDFSGLVFAFAPFLLCVLLFRFLIFK